MQSPKGAKRGPTEKLEGPRTKDGPGDPDAGGMRPADAGGVEAEGQPSLDEARGADLVEAAAAAGAREDAGLDEDDSARQPRQGGVETEGKTALTQRPTGTAGRKAGTAAGLETVAEGEEGGLDEEATPAGAGAAAAAHGAAGNEETFEEMVQGYPGSFWSAVEDDGIIEKPGQADRQTGRHTEKHKGRNEDRQTGR